MSTHINDFAHTTLLQTGAAPQTATTAVTGPTTDFITGDGACFAVQAVGTVSGTSPSLAGKIRESADGSNWADVVGASFTTVTGPGSIQVITFQRTQRYLRYEANVSGTSPQFALAVLLGEPKKQV